MVKMAADYALKLIALSIAAGLLFVYWQRRDDGRYVYHGGETETAILDSRSGTLYTLQKVEDERFWAESHPQTGETIARKLKIAVGADSASK
jgi:hypothetical protein